MQANELDIAEPTSPSKCKAPRRYEVGFDTGVTPYSTEDHFRANYYEALDTVISCISDRFKYEGSCDIMDLKYVFIQRIAENDLSLKTFVTGITSNNFTSLTTWDNNCFSPIDIPFTTETALCMQVLFSGG